MQSSLLLLAAIFLAVIAIIKYKKTPKKNLANLQKDPINMIIHELRAPLISIKDSSKIMMSSKYNLSQAEKKQLLEIINGQSKILLDQIGTILDSAKLEAGKLTITKSPADLGKIIQEQIKIFLPQATNKNISLSSSIPSSLPRISIDSTRIDQVMNNLLSNSLKFTQDKGKIEVFVKYNLQDKHIIVSVSDTGIGIPKEYQKYLFAKFSQVNTTQALIKQGNGLGLYIVKGIIEAHHGAVSLESTPQKGTTISFTLPIENQEIGKV